MLYTKTSSISQRSGTDMSRKPKLSPFEIAQKAMPDPIRPPKDDASLGEWAIYIGNQGLGIKEESDLRKFIVEVARGKKVNQQNTL